MPHQKPFALCTLKIGTAAGELLLHPPLHRIVQALRVPHEEHLHRAPACGRELLGLDTKIKRHKITTFSQNSTKKILLSRFFFLFFEASKKKLWT